MRTEHKHQTPSSKVSGNTSRQGREAKYRTTLRLFEKYRARLRRFADLCLDDRISARVDASDIVQEGYLEASQRLDELADLSSHSLLNLLKGISRRRAIDSYRRHVRAKRRSVLNEVPADAPAADNSRLRLADILVSNTSTPESKVKKSESLRIVRAAFEQLSPGDRDLLMQRHLRHQSVEALARRLQASRAVIATRHLRAIRRLRRILESQSKASDP